VSPAEGGTQSGGGAGGGGASSGLSGLGGTGGFDSFTNGGDGGFPGTPLIIDSKGNLLGTAQFGGAYTNGVVFAFPGVAAQ